MSRATDKTDKQKCLDCLTQAIAELHGRVDEHQLLTISNLIIQTMTGPWRSFHTPNHIFEVGEGGDSGLGIAPSDRSAGAIGETSVKRKWMTWSEAAVIVVILVLLWCAVFTSVVVWNECRETGHSFTYCVRMVAR